MIGAYECVGLLVFFWWAIARIAGLLVRPRRAQALGFLGAALIALGFSQTTFTMFALASLAPFGAVFPALLYRNLRRWRGADVRDFSTTEIAALFAFYTALILSSAGYFNFDPYGYGYGPLSGGLIALGAITYFLMTRRSFLASAALIGQLAWTFDIGSSNILDHLGHGLLVPALLVILVHRLLKLVRNK